MRSINNTKQQIQIQIDTIDTQHPDGLAKVQIRFYVPFWFVHEKLDWKKRLKTNMCKTHKQNTNIIHIHIYIYSLQNIVVHVCCVV